jgi:hypothetical protein
MKRILLVLTVAALMAAMLAANAVPAFACGEQPQPETGPYCAPSSNPPPPSVGGGCDLETGSGCELLQPHFPDLGDLDL